MKEVVVNSYFAGTHMKQWKFINKKLLPAENMCTLHELH